MDIQRKMRNNGLMRLSPCQSSKSSVLSDSAN